MAGDTPQTVRQLGQAEYDPASKTIRVNGRVTLLDRRAADVFALLVDRLGERISKDELLATVWQGRIVHENSVAKVISRLRAALQGSGVSIVASYGIGYILREDTPDPVADSPAPGENEPNESRSPKRTPMLAALFVVAGMATVVIIALFARREISLPIRQTWPITNDRQDAIATLLWVDDHPTNNQLDVAAFQQKRLAVHLAKSTEDALNLLAINRYQLVISDLGRGDDRLAGLRMIGEMKRRGITVPVMIYTLRPDSSTAQAAQRDLVRQSGAADLAVTPQEVRAKVLDRFASKI